jgi:hypothetical protein
MDPHEYDAYIKDLPHAEARVMMALRESRYVNGWFPAHSSGSGDAVEHMLNELRREWGLPEKFNEDWWWNRS